jgi:hypothetical protein
MEILSPRESLTFSLPDPKSEEPRLLQRNKTEACGLPPHFLGTIGRFAAIGLLGTIAFDVVMYVDLAVTGLPLEIPSVLGKLVVGESPFAEPLGKMVHYANGIGLALIFGFIALPISKKIAKLPMVVYGIIFAVIELVIAVWLGMLPALGAGIAGLNIGPEVAIVTLLRHLAFGSVIGILVGRWRK